MPIKPIKEEIVSQKNCTTGVEALDKVLGGGFPEGHVILLAGSSGSGKTIFTFQWLFEGVRKGENGIYITFTEPLFKALRNVEGMSFYDRKAVEEEKLKIVDMRDMYQTGKVDTEWFIAEVEKYVKETGAKRLCVDSITAIAYNLDEKAEIRKFIFELGKVLATLGCTTILTSEVTDQSSYSVYNVEEFISDAIVRLDQIKFNNELERRMGIIKVRGRSYSSEDMYFRITQSGIILFPKMKVSLDYSSTDERHSIGVKTLDEMLSGGVFRGSSTIISGATGTGKTLLCTQFIYDGLKNNEPCLFVGFEESKDQLLRNAKGFGWDLDKYEKSGLLIFRCMYPSEKHAEEHLYDIKGIIESKKIKRCVVDSLYAISNSFPDDVFSSFTKRLGGYLKSQNVTTIFTAATSGLVGATTLTEGHISLLADNIMRTQYVEVQGELKSVLNVVKVRGSGHSKGLREYRITGQGIVIGQPLAGYEGVMTGVTRKVSASIEEKVESKFREFIGPMTDTIFQDLKDKGLERDAVLDYVASLERDGILTKEDSKKFREALESILGGKKSVSEEILAKSGLFRRN